MGTSGGVNKVILAGNVASEPRWETEGGRRCLHFKLITVEMVHSARGNFEQEETHLVKVPENCMGLRRMEVKLNDMLFIQGSVQTTIFHDDKGIRRFRAEVVATQLELLTTGIPAANLHLAASSA